MKPTCYSRALDAEHTRKGTMKNMDIEKRWVHCPICNSKTRVMVSEDTVLYRFPLYCPRCKNETIVTIANFGMTIHTQPRDKSKTIVRI